MCLFFKFVTISLLGIFIQINTSFSQKIDSLQVLLKNTKSENEKRKIVIEIAFLTAQTNITEGKTLIEQCLPTREDTLGKALFYQSMYNECIISANNSKYELVKYYYPILVKYFTKEKDLKKYYKILNCYSTSLVFSSDFESTKVELQKIKLAIDADNDVPYEGKIKLYNNFGILYAMNDYLDLALQYFLMSDSIAKSENKAHEFSNITGYIANVYRLLSNNEMAISYYLKAKKMAIEQADFDSGIAICDNLAMLYNETNQAAKALEELAFSRTLFQSTTDSIDIATNYLLTVEIIVNNRFDLLEASKYLKKAEKILSLRPEQYTHQLYYKNKAVLHHALKDYKTQIKAGEKLLNLALKNNNKSNKISAYYHLWIANDSLGNFEEAYNKCRWYYYLQDSLSKAKYNDKIVAIQEKLDNQYKKNEIERLTTEASLAQELSDKKEQFNQFLIIIVIFILIVLIIISYFYFKIRNVKKQVESQNNLLLQSDNQKAVLLKELHHRVKNNLQIVSSLLSLQGDAVKDELAQIAFKEGQNRVDAMAMIHRHLYTTDELTSVNIASYIERLVLSVAFSYCYTKDNFTLKSNILQKPIDVDVAIPIGLIVNELISNTFKHAFTKEQNAIIEISIIEENDKLVLKINDNGKGLPENFSLNNSGSFGLELVETLVYQLKGSVSVVNMNGAQFTIEIQQQPKTLAA